MFGFILLVVFVAIALGLVQRSGLVPAPFMNGIFLLVALLLLWALYQLLTGHSVNVGALR